jgi:hypothetical protein
MNELLAIVGIFAVVLGFCAIVVVIGGEIAVYAVILNLEIPGEVRFLLIALAVMLIGIGMTLRRITRLQEKQINIALGKPQNENDDSFGDMVLLLSRLIVLCGIGVVLHYGIFGSFG